MNIKNLKNFLNEKGRELFRFRKKEKKFLIFSAKPKPWHIVIFLVAILITFLYLSNDKTSNKIGLEINNNFLSVETAETPQERYIGLMHRNKLDKDSGMLFTFEREAVHSFWMKNTKIPLDMIWISSDKKVVAIEHSAPPCNTTPCPSYIPDSPAKYVLETNGGWTLKHNIKIGDEVKF